MNEPEVGSGVAPLKTKKCELESRTIFLSQKEVFPNGRLYTCPYLKAWC